MNAKGKTVVLIRNLLAVVVVYAAHGVGFAAEPLQVTIADITFPNTYANEQWLIFQHNIEQASGEDIALKLLITGQLGSEDQLMSGLRRGRVQYASVSALFVSTVVPEAALLCLIRALRVRTVIGDGMEMPA